MPTIIRIHGDSISIVSGVMGSVIGIAMNVVIMNYLYRLHVKIFFRKP